MCLIVEKGTTPKVAEQDIIVFKAFKKYVNTKLFRPKQLFGLIKAKYKNEEYITSMIQNHRYEFGPQPEIIMEEEPNGKCFGDVDFKYLYKKYGYNWREESDEIIAIGTGYHSAKSMQRFRDEGDMDDTYVYYKCIVPKGSLYYEDATDLLVSNNLIITKEEQTL